MPPVSDALSRMRDRNPSFKKASQIEHTRHRSLGNFMVNLLCGLIAYCHQPKKPALKIQKLPLLKTAYTELTLI